MIEQTELVVKEWHYHPPNKPVEPGSKISNEITLEVMKKRASTKKGIACRFTCSFIESEIILRYVAEDSYVIDLDDEIEKKDLLSMITNSYSKFRDVFELRKYGTALSDKSLIPLNEAGIDLDSLLLLLK